MVDCIFIYKPPLADRKFLLTSCLNLLHCGFPLILVSPILSSLPLLLWITFQMFECHPLSRLFYGLKISIIQPFLTRFYFWPPLTILKALLWTCQLVTIPSIPNGPVQDRVEWMNYFPLSGMYATINATKLLLTSH